MNTNHYKQKLEEEKKLLEKELTHIGVRDPKNPPDWSPKAEEGIRESADLNITADKFEEFEERLDTSDALEIRLKNVSDALMRIEHGTYGTCEIGGEIIEEDRLEANPAAKTCKKHMEDWKQ